MKKLTLLLLAVSALVPTNATCQPQTSVPHKPTLTNAAPALPTPLKPKKKSSAAITSVVPFIKEHAPLIALSTGSILFFIIVGYLLKKSHAPQTSSKQSTTNSTPPANQQPTQSVHEQVKTNEAAPAPILDQPLIVVPPALTPATTPMAQRSILKEIFFYVPLEMAKDFIWWVRPH